ncbi:MAG TPA: DinB family protein [Vicinamibacterales bacterium]|nr:DinB family protein [Vicinamibacterales bacterium]
MRSRLLIPIVACACLAAAAVSAQAQTDIKAAVVKHLTTSRDFTLKVANQMPEADYAFKLTPPQMSFAEQMVHLASEQAGLLAPFTNARPTPSKPASMSKKDVIAFVRQSFDQSIAAVSKLTPEQIGKTYSSGEGSMTGVELLMFLLDHTTHHRASAEMYLRAKGITPTEYQF